MQPHRRPELAPPVLFSRTIEVGGFIYFGGQIGQDPTTGKLMAGGIAAETERVFQNLSAFLKAAGKGFDHVARAGVYLTNVSDYVALNGLRQALQSALSRLHDDRGGGAAAGGLR
jgi:2-iminobutanoate/2-iminopropanoate deaminase